MQSIDLMETYAYQMNKNLLYKKQEKLLTLVMLQKKTLKT